MNLFRMPGLRMVLHAHFQRDFHGDAAVFRNEHAVERGQQLRKRGAELRNGFRGAVRHDDMFELHDLVDKRLAHGGMRVTEALAPPRADAVDKNASVTEEQTRAAGGIDEQRFKIFIIFHLGCGTPEVTEIFFDNRVHFTVSFFFSRMILSFIRTICLSFSGSSGRARQRASRASAFALSPRAARASAMPRSAAV